VNAPVVDARANTAAQIARSQMPCPWDGTAPNIRVVIDLARTRFGLDLTTDQAQAAIGQAMAR
jgi:hypothetical protein